MNSRTGLRPNLAATGSLESAGRGDETLGLLDRRHGDDRHVDHGRLIAVHLLGGEYRRGAGKQARFGLGLAGLGGDFKLLVEDDIGGFLALADLGAGLGPLAICAPGAGTVAGCLGIGPEGDDVDAAIAALIRRRDRSHVPT